MAYRLKEEYRGLTLNFPELRLKGLTEQDLDENTIQMLIRKGHGGYFEADQPVELTVSVDVEPVTEIPQAKIEQPTAGNAKAEQNAPQAKAEEPAAKEERPELKSTASTSSKAKNVGAKRGPKAKALV